MINMTRSFRCLEIFRYNGASHDMPVWAVDWRFDCDAFWPKDHSSISYRNPPLGKPATVQDLLCKDELSVTAMIMAVLDSETENIRSDLTSKQWGGTSTSDAFQRLLSSGAYVRRRLRELRDDGCVGLYAPKDAQPGDLLAHFEGGILPFIIRPIPGEPQPHHGRKRAKYLGVAAFWHRRKKHAAYPPDPGHATPLLPGDWPDEYISFDLETWCESIQDFSSATVPADGASGNAFMTDSSSRKRIERMVGLLESGGSDDEFPMEDYTIT